MPKKTGGMPYMVYTSPKKGKDGRNIVFVRPEGGPRMKRTAEQMDAYCTKYSMMRSGELQLVLQEFMHWAAEWLVKGYRVETPLGSFAPKLRLKREITDPDEVSDRDVELDGGLHPYEGVDAEGYRNWGFQFQFGKIVKRKNRK